MLDSKAVFRSSCELCLEVAIPFTDTFHALHLFLVLTVFIFCHLTNKDEYYINNVRCLSVSTLYEELPGHHWTLQSGV